MSKPRFCQSLLLSFCALTAFVGIGTEVAVAETTPRIEVEVETVRTTPQPWGAPHSHRTVTPVVIPEVVIPEPEVEEVEEVEAYEEFEIIVPTSSPHALAGTFACVESAYSHVPPTTVFYSPEGALPVIHWVSHYFEGAGYDPLTRCRDVSNRFQRYYEAGVLNYITTGIVNRLPVVCVSDEMGGPCQGVLLTLKPGQNASYVVQRLFDLSYGHQVGALYESGSRVYIDVDNYLSGLNTLESER